MTAVTIRGTFLKDSRPNNGLETIADDLIADKTETHYVVGMVKWAGGNVSEDGSLTPAVKFLAVEPLFGAEAEAASEILDRARKARGLGRFEEQLTKATKSGGEMAGQIPFDYDGPADEGDGEEAETRLGPDGEREVPEPSGEEIMAERAEAKAAAVPAAQFSGGDSDA